MLSGADRKKAADILMGAEKERKQAVQLSKTWPNINIDDAYAISTEVAKRKMKAGAKLVNVISNSVVPKITVILGGSFGAGNYALCGKAFDPRFIFAWPSAKYAVMGGDQAADTLLEITVQALRRGGHEPDAKELEELRDKVKASYDEQTDVRYAAARL